MSIAQDIEERIAPLAEAEHMEVVDVQLAPEAGKKVLRVFLDKEGGFSLGDCEQMSRKLGDFIDEHELVKGAYVLEVSSPGIDRVLKKEKDFVRFKGSKARITVYEPIEGQRNFVGPITDVEAGQVSIEDTSGKKVRIPIDRMAKARLEPELEI